jgi:hypothetical protein
MTITTKLGVPRSTARGWLGAAPTVVVSLGGREPHAAGTPAGNPEAAATRQEARGAPPIGARLVTHIRVQALRSACAERLSQAANPAGRGSGARAYPKASGPPVPACFAVGFGHNGHTSSSAISLPLGASRAGIPRGEVLGSKLDDDRGLEDCIQLVLPRVRGAEYELRPAG